MNRTRSLAASVLCLGMLASPYAAGQQKDEHEGHHPEEKAPAAKPAPARPPQKPAGAPRAGMDQGAMEQHMKAMRGQMERIKAARDPKERERLMQEHMASMQQMMKGMHGAPASGASKGGSGSPAMRMEMMERRMDMMQGMMEQMMGRMIEHEKMAPAPR